MQCIFLLPPGRSTQLLVVWETLLISICKRLYEEDRVCNFTINTLSQLFMPLAMRRVIFCWMNLARELVRSAMLPKHEKSVPAQPHLFSKTSQNYVEPDAQTLAHARWFINLWAPAIPGSGYDAVEFVRIMFALISQPHVYPYIGALAARVPLAMDGWMDRRHSGPINKLKDPANEVYSERLATKFAAQNLVDDVRENTAEGGVDPKKREW